MRERESKLERVIVCVWKRERERERERETIPVFSTGIDKNIVCTNDWVMHNSPEVHPSDIGNVVSIAIYNKIFIIVGD